MNKFSCLLITITLLAFNSKIFAQSYPTINKDALFELIDKDSEHQFFAVFIFTNGCSGGIYMNNLKRELDSITKGETKFVFAQASRGNDRGKDLENAVALFKIDKSELYLIDETTYKTDRKDSRKQGMLLRNDICTDCKFMTIGTVYKLIFDKEKNLLYHGLFSDKKQLSAILKCK